MVRFGQIVMGPAGSGKSTYCKYMQEHFSTMNRNARVINMDPAAESFEYDVFLDIRELIQLDDVMEDEEMHLGPNGGLIFCLEYFRENFEWLHEHIAEEDEDYYIFDCPGQIELYTHIPVMKEFIQQLKEWDFNLCGLYLLDSQFMIEPSKFLGGVLTALSSMIHLEIPSLNVLSKCDLLSSESRHELERYLDPDLTELLLTDAHHNRKLTKNLNFAKMNHGLAKVISDFSLVRFIPLNINDEDSLHDLTFQIDTNLQYDECLEFKEPKEFENFNDVDRGVEPNGN